MNAIYFGPLKGVIFSAMLLATLAAIDARAQTSSSTSSSASGSSSNSQSTSGAAAVGVGGTATGTGVGIGGAGGSAVGIGGTGVGGAGGLGGQGGLGGSSSSTSQGGSSSSTSAGGASNSNATGGNSTSAGGSSRSRSNATGGTGQGGQGGNAQSANGLTFNQGNNSPVTQPAAPSDITVRSAPQVYVPSVVTGNVCAVGASGGASFIGTGFAIGATWESEQCERRQTAALLHNAGYRDASRELMCDKREIYDAMRRAGTPCLSRPQWDPPPTMAGQPAPPIVVTPAPYRPAAFNAGLYAGGAECLTAASAAGAPYSACAGKP